MTMTARKAFMVYFQWFQYFDTLRPDVAYQSIRMLASVAEGGKLESVGDAAADMMLCILSDTVQRDAEKYAETCEKRREAGRKGGLAPRKDSFCGESTLSAPATQPSILPTRKPAVAAAEAPENRSAVSTDTTPPVLSVCKTPSAPVAKVAGKSSAASTAATSHVHSVLEKPSVPIAAPAADVPAVEASNPVLSEEVISRITGQITQAVVQSVQCLLQKQAAQQPAAVTEPVDTIEIVPQPPKPRRRRTAPLSPASSALFDRFWTAYPKKTGIEAARKAFARVSPTESLVDKMVDAISWQTHSRQWTADGGRYIPSPANWLKAAHWEDQPMQTDSLHGEAPSYDLDAYERESLFDTVIYP